MIIAHTSWRLFPLAAVLSLLVVVAVNGTLAWYALSTFPGLAVSNDFDTSNTYDQVLATAERQAALGWKLQAEIEAGRALITLKDRNGLPIEDAVIVATAQRPLGPTQASRPRFVHEGQGRYRSDTTLTLPGQWDLLLHIEANGQVFSATRRVVAK